MAMSSNLPQIVVVDSLKRNEEVASVVSGKSHTAKTRSISSLISSTSSFLQQQPPPPPPLQLLPNKKPPPMTSFKVEAEIVNTDSSKNVSLFENADNNNNNTIFNSNDHIILNPSDMGQNSQISNIEGNDNGRASDSEETFVYDTLKKADNSQNDDTPSIGDGERPILIHKNSVRSSFMMNHNNNSQPRLFSQTVLPDNESIVSKKFIQQRRIPTLQQQQSQTISSQQPQLFGVLPNHQLQRFASKNQYQPSLSSRSLTGSNNTSLRPVQVESDLPNQINSDTSDQESFVSEDFGRIESDDGGDTENGVDDEGGDDTNTTLKLNNKSSFTSPVKSFSDPTLQLSNSKSRLNKHTRNLIISQVRNVSKNLFENEKNYLKKKLSFGSLKEDDERSLILHNTQNDGSDDDFQFYYRNNNNNNNEDPRNSRESNNYNEHWNSNFNFNGRYHQRVGLHNNNTVNDDFYYYPTYDSINPHNYVSKYRKQNILLKIISILLRILILLILFITISKVFIIKFITNPILNFEITKLEKLIIADNLLIFDVDCSCTNINLQDVTIDQSDLDIFISYTNEDDIEKTLLLGNISSFFVPLKFNGILNDENVPFMKIFNASYARNLTMNSVGQLKLNGDFKDVNENIEFIINGPFELNIRGSFRYKLPFSPSDGLISVSKKYRHKE